MPIEKKIRLAAHTNDDLKVLSYLCQDAILSKEEFFYDKERKLFIATLSRYCWEKKEIRNEKGKSIKYRVVSGLQIKNVKKITNKILETDNPFFNLLAISYNRKKIILNFSMSLDIILSCEKIDVLLEDIDIPWPTKLKPEHK